MRDDQTGGRCENSFVYAVAGGGGNLREGRAQIAGLLEREALLHARARLRVDTADMVDFVKEGTLLSPKEQQRDSQGNVNSAHGDGLGGT